MIYNDILKNETEKVIPTFSVNAALKNFTYEDLKTAAPSEYGTILTAVLKNLSLTQQDLAELTGLGSASISRVCNNKTNPRKSTMKKIIDTLSELDPNGKKEAALEQKYEEQIEYENNNTTDSNRDYKVSDLDCSTNENYGAILKDLILHKLSLTYREFAELSGVHETQISDYCNGKVYPYGITRMKISDTLRDLIPDSDNASEETKCEAVDENLLRIMDLEPNSLNDGWELAKEIAALGYGMREKIYGIGDMEKFMNTVSMKSAKKCYENYRKNLIKPGVIALYKDTIKCLVVKVDRNFATIFIPETGLSKEVPVLNLKKTAEKLNI